MSTHIREEQPLSLVAPQADSARRPGRSLHLGQRPDVTRLAVVIALITTCVGLFVTVGADARWLAALGGTITSRGAIPSGVPFAAASTSHWANSLVLAELIFHALEAPFGDRGLALANLLAVAAGLGILAADARAEGGRGTVIVGSIALASLGALPSLAIARVQMFSLVLFPLMVALLRAEARQPSRRIWWSLPLLALWSNLHGAALAGLALLYGYLAFQRLRHDRLTTVGVALGALVALCVTPAGITTIDYYHGLLTNVAAQQGVGQWAPLGHSPFDWVLVITAALLVVRVRHHRPRLWEIVVIVGLTALTIKAARDGVWLLFFLVGPASHGKAGRREWNGLIPIAAAVALLLLVLDVTHAPRHIGASSQMVQRAVRLASGSPILADGIPAEQVALAGGRIWAGNPLDAFARAVQSKYVAWVDASSGSRQALLVPGVRIILVSRNSAPDRLMRGLRTYRETAADATSVIYVRDRAGVRSAR